MDFYSSLEDYFDIELANGATMPQRATMGSVGFDLACLEDFELVDKAIVETGITLKAKSNEYYAQIMSRSGLATKGVIAAGGVIDLDYRGSLKVILLNTSREKMVFKAGQRIAQVVVLRVPPVISYCATNPDFRSRGDNWAGSTGL